MKIIARSLIRFGCGFAVVLLSRTAVADKLHTPGEGSAERTAILDGLRTHWQSAHNPDDGRTYRGKITFKVNYLMAHNGWAWVYAEPRSSLSKERFPENSGFLLRLQSGRWFVMKLPPMEDNGDGAFNPTKFDIARVRKMYPSVAEDVIPVELRP
jgi:hypothetical protein